MGKVEENIFQSIGVQCQKYTPTGSVKLGLSIERAKESSNSSFDLCFISHYRPELFAKDTPKHYPLIEKNQRILFKHISDYAFARGLSLAVISKTRETELQLAEEEYFSTIAGTVPFKFIPADKHDHELDSYLAGLASGLVIHPASTLGFELFAAGKKVLFGSSADSALIQQWGIQHYFDALPDLVKLESDSSDEFIKRCDQVRAMPDAKYQEMTRTAATTIVSMSELEFPHETVKQLIYDLLA
jgi:surface carbohydrate biosynthesis protein